VDVDMGRKKESVLVIGLGEIGQPIFEILKESGHFIVYGFDVDERKMRKLGQNAEFLPKHVDVMHICIPCVSKEQFTETTIEYANKFKPKLIIIESTVPPGTTFQIYEKCKHTIVHSPVYGTHKNPEYMRWEIRRWTKIIGGVDAKSAKMASQHFKKAGIKTRILKSPVETELTKLFETIYSAWMIVFFQEMHRISRFFGADFDEIVSAIGEIHRVRLDRPIWYPGVIGGHCLIPNTELLLKVYDSEFLRLILKSNEKRKEEIKDETVRLEVEKVKKRVQALKKELIERLSCVKS
jgi:UDP-N-acetyl-D-mannosaminuronate dehydrogenase